MIELRHTVGKNGTEIMYTEIRKDEHGELYYYINGDTGYRLKDWTKEDAERHYLSDEGQIERDISFRAAWGFYD